MTKAAWVPEAAGALETPDAPDAQDSATAGSLEAPGVPGVAAAEPHVIRLVVWGLPSPAVVDTPFTLSAGAKCSAGCKLTGRRLEVSDQRGVKVAEGTLSDAPRHGTAALYWTELVVQAPSDEGLHHWELSCPPSEEEPFCRASSCTFAFRTAGPPEHVVAIEVLSRDTQKTPVKKAVVSLNSEGACYRGVTDAAGTVRVSVPKGVYRLSVMASGYSEWEGSVEVADELAVKAELWFRT